jgi:hypothetical protein
MCLFLLSLLIDFTGCEGWVVAIALLRVAPFGHALAMQSP